MHDQLGRKGDVDGEGIDDAQALQRAIAAGTEHLSSLREAYLESLAAQAQLDYRTVATPSDLATSLRARRYARQTPVQMPLAGVLAGVGLLVLAIYLLLPTLNAWRSQPGRAKKRQPLRA